MKAERRGLWMAAALVALVGMGVAGCGSSDKKDQGATKNNVGDAAHTVLVDLATKKEKDLGPAYGGVWTVS